MHAQFLSLSLSLSLLRARVTHDNKAQAGQAVNARSKSYRIHRVYDLIIISIRWLHNPPVRSHQRVVAYIFPECATALICFEQRIIFVGLRIWRPYLAHRVTFCSYIRLLTIRINEREKETERELVWKLQRGQRQFSIERKSGFRPQGNRTLVTFYKHLVILFSE